MSYYILVEMSFSQMKVFLLVEMSFSQMKEFLLVEISFCTNERLLLVGMSFSQMDNYWIHSTQVSAAFLSFVSYIGRLDFI